MAVLRLRQDRNGAISWLVMGAIAAVIILVAAAWLVLGSSDSPDINKPHKDDKYRLVIIYRFENTNYPGGIWTAPESKRVFKVSYEEFDYDSYKWRPGSLWSGALWDFGEDNRFEYKLKFKITGPNGFDVGETYKLEYEIGEGNSRTVDFGVRHVYIEQPGVYRVMAKLWVHAPAEDVAGTDDLDHALIWTDSKSVVVE